MNLFLLRETLDMAGRALVANRLRSILALLGIVIGVGTVIGMVSLINGFQRSFQKSIQSFGNNTIYIRRIRPGFQFGQIPDSLKQRKAFTMGDAEAILSHATAVRAIAPFKFPFGEMQVTRQSKKARGVFCYGTNEDYLTTHGYDLARGRFFTQQEVERNAHVVVLGKDTREALFGDKSGLGEEVHVNGIPFTLIGEFEPKGRMLGNNFDQVAAIPYTAMDKYFAAPQDAPPWFPKRGELFLDAIATSPEASDLAQQQIMEILRVRRHLPSNKTNDFVVFTDDQFLSLYNSITGGIFALMGLISGISLLVGGIGVMNIMLVAVTERTREIGVRKALGAPRSAILSQFLIESVLLTAAGGVLGILLGATISWGIHAASQMPTYVSLWSVITGIVFSAIVGVFFGLYPAMRASRLDPVDSLRYE
ncbi:MAG: ABC transporter permease [Candidatus Eisenbacteria bacterium]|uniref:ABC transporter permease n=1 Tax=Eiseniibacteriota bacterium TaxID=2212470 RepID=A0A9D6QK07_UNCEI|nr:ABC transporter permease [Candidatus Eisenbacteria bacterium]MBI3539706.1 ABC transporter permease [Candidatus Eisenbacteria bacterium]